MLLSFLLMYFHSSTSFASNLLLRCEFNQEAKPKNHFITSIDLMGVVQTEGVISGKKFKCRHQMQEFNFNSVAVIPNVEFTLKKENCTGDATIIGRIKNTITLTIEKNRDKKGVVCSEDLVVNYPSAKDKSPFYEGKMVKLHHEKYKAKVWP